MAHRHDAAKALAADDLARSLGITPTILPIVGPSAKLTRLLAAQRRQRRPVNTPWYRPMPLDLDPSGTPCAGDVILLRNPPDIVGAVIAAGAEGDLVSGRLVSVLAIERDGSLIIQVKSGGLSECLSAPDLRDGAALIEGIVRGIDVRIGA